MGHELKVMASKSSRWTARARLTTSTSASRYRRELPVSALPGRSADAAPGIWARTHRSEQPSGREEPPLPALRAGVPGYVLGHQANLEYGFTALGNLRARVGDRGRVPGAEQHAPANAWMRVYADEIDIAGNRFAAEDLQMTNVQFGTDLYAHASGSASTHFGVMASVGESRAALFDSARAVAGLATLAGEMQTDAKGVGMYWTHFGTNGVTSISRRRGCTTSTAIATRHSPMPIRPVGATLSPPSSGGYASARMDDQPAAAHLSTPRARRVRRSDLARRRGERRWPEGPRRRAVAACARNWLGMKRVAVHRHRCAT